MPESSFDIVSEFDFQELRNAVDQTQREISTRYDFKGLFCEIDLKEDVLTITTTDKMKADAVKSVLVQKMVNRKVSPKILDVQEVEQVGGGNVKLAMKLIKALDQENAKKISKMIRDKFPKVKPSIQGESVRVKSKSKDELQGIIKILKETEDIKVPLQFVNYR